MLSTAAFNALLKTLEEPPAHVKFILCTTDPLKVPQTIQSRCQRFDFHRFSEAEIVDNLKRVSAAEGFQVDEDALSLIAAHASGGMRDALVALEQIAVFGSGAVSVDAARSLLGSVRPEQLSTIAGHIASRNAAACLIWVAELVRDGADIASFAHELTRYLRNLYIVSVLGDDAASLVTWVYEDKSLSDLSGMAAAFGSFDRLAACLGIAADLNQQLKGTTDDRLTLEMALIRMARPETDLTLESLAARVALLENQLTVGKVFIPESMTTCSSDSAGTSDVSALLDETDGGQPMPASTRPMVASVASDSSITPTAGLTSSTDFPLPSGAAFANHSGAVAATADQPTAADNQPRVVTDSAESAAPRLQTLRNNADAQRLWSGVMAALKKDKQNRLVSLLDNARASLGSDGNSLLIGLPESDLFAFRSISDSGDSKTVKRYVEQLQGTSIEVVWQLGYQEQPASKPQVATDLIPAQASQEREASSAEAAVSDKAPASANPDDETKTPEEYLLASFGNRVMFERLSDGQQETPGDSLASGYDDMTMPLLDEPDL